MLRTAFGQCEAARGEVIQADGVFEEKGEHTAVRDEYQTSVTVAFLQARDAGDDAVVKLPNRFPARRGGVRVAAEGV